MNHTCQEHPFLINSSAILVDMDYYLHSLIITGGDVRFSLSVAVQVVIIFLLFYCPATLGKGRERAAEIVVYDYIHM